MSTGSRVSDGRDGAFQLRRTVQADRERRPRERQADDGERRCRALLMLAPVFGLAIWGALIALVV